MLQEGNQLASFVRSQHLAHRFIGACLQTTPTHVLSCRFPAKMRAGQGKAVLRWIGQHAQHATSLRLLGQGDKGTAVPFCKFLLPGLRYLLIQVIRFAFERC